MPTPVTKLHGHRLMQQTLTALLNVQTNLVGNATKHKQMAQAQSPDIDTLRTFVNDCASMYLRNIKFVTDGLASDKKQRMLQAGGWAEKDVTDLTNHLFAAAQMLQNAPKETYAEIVASCDQVLATVDPLESLWPE